jgi:hypothetical protein
LRPPFSKLFLACQGVFLGDRRLQGQFNRPGAWFQVKALYRQMRLCL